MKLYQLVACLDEGVMYSWLFKAESIWHIANYIVENYQDYPKIYQHLGLDPYSRYEEEKITPEVLLNAIGESQIDGDSAYGYEFYEFEESDIKVINNLQPTPTSDYKKYLNSFTGHRNYPYENYILFQNSDYEQIDNLVNIQWHQRSEDNYFGFDEWLSKSIDIDINTKSILSDLSEKAHSCNFEWKGFETVAKFIVPVMNLANIETDGYQIHYDRLLEGMIKNTFLKGRIDMYIGKRYNNTYNIDFVLCNANDKGSASTPAILTSQMLTVMHNKNQEHLKGAYISNGRLQFVIIERDEQQNFHVHEYKGLNLEKQEDVELIFRFITAVRKNTKV